MKKVLVLVDADNVNASYAEALFSSICNDESECEIHIFGKFEEMFAADWLYMAHRRGIYEHIYGGRKNITDLQMIKVAYTKIYTEAFTDVVIVSSDMDMKCVVTEIPSSIKVTVAYCKQRTSLSYIAWLNKHVDSIDLEEIRPPLSKDVLPQLADAFARSYLQHKICNYWDTSKVRDVLASRYPEFSSLTTKEFAEACKSIQLRISEAGLEFER